MKNKTSKGFRKQIDEAAEMIAESTFEKSVSKPWYVRMMAMFFSF